MKGNFDREISQQLFDRAEKSIDGRIYANEFIKVFFEAEEMLKYKLGHFQTKIEELKRQKTSFQRKGNENPEKETSNVFGVSDDSKFIIKINGMSLKMTNGSSLNAVIQCGDIRKEVNTLRSPTFSSEEEFDLYSDFLYSVPLSQELKMSTS